MNPDEVIEFLNMFDKTKDDQFPYLEYYYEYLINKPITPDSYFNVLGTLYIEKLFRLQPRSFLTPSKFDVRNYFIAKTVEDKVKEYRGKLQRFLETKKQYE